MKTPLVISIDSQHSFNPENPTKHILSVGMNKPGALFSWTTFSSQEDLLQAVNLLKKVVAYYESE